MQCGKLNLFFLMFILCKLLSQLDLFFAMMIHVIRNIYISFGIHNKQNDLMHFGIDMISSLAYTIDREKKNV